AAELSGATNNPASSNAASMKRLLSSQSDLDRRRTRPASVSTSLFTEPTDPVHSWEGQAHSQLVLAAPQLVFRLGSTTGLISWTPAGFIKQPRFGLVHDLRAATGAAAQRPPSRSRLSSKNSVRCLIQLLASKCGSSIGPSAHSPSWPAELVGFRLAGSRAAQAPTTARPTKHLLGATVGWPALS
ncbi:MAG: hypothetical protein QOE71_3688, partial [Pseudonocardiales bacterium]|nr:hypothetical protein [Pseudonocardiales bacterium]